MFGLSLDLSGWGNDTMQQHDGERTGLPDLFADGMLVTISPFAVNITFTQREPHPAQGRQPEVQNKAIVRMSPEHAKIMTMLLRRNLLEYERRMGGQIKLPMEIYRDLGVAEEDWNH